MTTPLAHRDPVAMAQHIRQIEQETPLEALYRKNGGYLEIEQKMPDLPNRHKKVRILDRFTSLLGENNPFANPVNGQEHTVWLFNNTAFRVPGTQDQWKAEVVAAYFVKDSGDDTSDTVAKISEIIGIAKDDAARARISQRLQPFLDSVLPAHIAHMEIKGQRFKLGPSSHEGISSNLVKFTSARDGGAMLHPNLAGMKSETPMTTFFAEETGWAVISDVDDTIKKTMTATALGVLKTTFVEDPEPISGMPELYAFLTEAFDRPPFWYLSASPYNLYAFLMEFLGTAQYPPGTLILRDASWMSLAGLLSSVTQGTQAYKTDRIRKVHSWFPKRKFICFGDSTQTDPESYGEIYREFPDWVKGIFIRKVVGVAETEGPGDDEKNTPERFEKAFKGVPRDVWYVFEDPEEVKEKLENLKARGLNG